MKDFKNTLTNFRNVVVRELQRIFRRPLYLLSTVVLMGFIYLFFFTFMDEGLPQNLPIAVVDYDGSSISRRLARELEATPNVTIKYRFVNFGEARDAMQRGEIYSFLVIPQDFASDILAFRRPTISYYTNQGYMMGASLSMKELMTISNLVPAAVQRELLRAKGYNDKTIMGMIQPIVVDTHLVGNPYVNYPIYLLTTILPGLLGLIILLTTTFAIGIEIKNGTSRQWLHAAGKSYHVAILGKMFPYTILYLLLELVGLCIMYLVLDFSIAGNLGYYMVGALIYIIVMQALGVFIIGIIPVTTMANSIATLYGILAITMAGFTLPVESMYPAVQGLSLLFPLRYFYLFMVDTTLIGANISETVHFIATILIFLFVPLTVERRLHKAIIYQNYPKN